MAQYNVNCLRCGKQYITSNENDLFNTQHYCQDCWSWTAKELEQLQSSRKNKKQ